MLDVCASISARSRRKIQNAHYGDNCPVILEFGNRLGRMRSRSNEQDSREEEGSVRRTPEEHSDAASDFFECCVFRRSPVENRNVAAKMPFHTRVRGEKIGRLAGGADTI